MNSSNQNSFLLSVLTMAQYKRPISYTPTRSNISRRMWRAVFNVSFSYTPTRSNISRRMWRAGLELDEALLLMHSIFIQCSAQKLILSSSAEILIRGSKYASAALPLRFKLIQKKYFTKKNLGSSKAHGYSFHYFPIISHSIEHLPENVMSGPQCGIAVDACVQRKDLEVLMALQVRFHCVSNRWSLFLFFDEGEGLSRFAYGWLRSTVEIISKFKKRKLDETITTPP